MKDIRTKAIVLRRTNYGETDRILNVLTPSGKISVLAKGVRKERSKIAGGIEMFSLSEITVHEGRGELAILTSARTKEFYQGVLANFDRMEAASEIIKRVARAAEQVDSTEYFSLVIQALRAINKGSDLGLIMAWYYFNLVRISGEQINLYTDTEGDELDADLNYTWDVTEKALRASESGKISVNEIKMMRLMISLELPLVLRVNGAEEMVDELLYIAKSFMV